MEKIGFIGYGSMGSMIINGLLSSNVLRPEKIMLATRTESKLAALRRDYPELEVVHENREIAQKCKKIFLFVGTGDLKGVIEEINEYLMEDAHIIYISAGLTLNDVGKVFKGKLTKVIPTVTSKIGEGVSLVCHKDVDKKDVEFVENIFAALGDVKIVDESDLEVATVLTSCAPAFIAVIIRKLAEAGSKRSSFSQEETEKMMIKTFYGTSKLLYEEGMAFDDVVLKVATPGGVTEEGVGLLEGDLPQLFDKVFRVSLGKHEVLKGEF